MRQLFFVPNFVIPNHAMLWMELDLNAMLPSIVQSGRHQCRIQEAMVQSLLEEFICSSLPQSLLPIFGFSYFEFKFRLIRLDCSFQN